MNGTSAPENSSDVSTNSTTQKKDMIKSNAIKNLPMPNPDINAGNQNISIAEQSESSNGTADNLTGSNADLNRSMQNLDIISEQPRNLTNEHPESPKRPADNLTGTNAASKRSIPNPDISSEQPKNLTNEHPESPKMPADLEFSSPSFELNESLPQTNGSNPIPRMPATNKYESASAKIWISVLVLGVAGIIGSIIYFYRTRKPAKNQQTVNDNGEKYEMLEGDDKAEIVQSADQIDQSVDHLDPI